MMCASDADVGQMEAERLPRVTFYDGLRLRRGGEVGQVLGGVPGTPLISVAWPSAGALLDHADLLADISRGLITVEPTVGMRVDCGRTVEPAVWRVDVLRGNEIRVRSEEDDADGWWVSVSYMQQYIRTGAWAILPPEKSAKPVDDAEPARAPDLETDPRILELEAACVERDQRIAELDAGVCRAMVRIADLERELKRAEASELLYETVLEAVEDMLAGREDAGAALMDNGIRLKNAGGNPGYAAGYMKRIASGIESLRTSAEAAEKRAIAAEQKLAELVALGVDALPAMYPDVTAVGVEHGLCGSGIVLRDGKWRVVTNHRITGTFREALHAAVLAVGGKWPGDDAGQK